MTPEQLKASILQYAIQGKLVEQRVEEGTGEELFQEIKRKREVLIKEKIIKKDKRTNSIINFQNVPFDIPENWMWVTLGSILNKLTDGTHKTPKYTSTGVRFVSVKDMSNGFLSLENTKFISEEEHKELYARCNPEKGDLILSKVGTTGVPAIVDTAEPFSLFVSVALLKFDCKCIDVEFLYYMLMSPLVQAQATENTRGVGNKNWVLDAIASTMVVLPPLSEQKRIVQKIKELLPYVDRYATAYEKLERFNAKFPEDMKKSILQYAIQGKLVEQRPEEGTGEELYQQIQAEKQHLIAEKKIKKEKPLPEIAENEIPFDIPESWKWVRLNNIAESIVDCPHSTPKYLDMETEYCTIDTNCIDGKGDITKWRYVDADTYTARIARLTPQKDDIVYTREGLICRAAILPEGPKVCLGQRVMLIRSANGVFPQFIRRLLMSPMVIRKLTEQQKGIGAKHVNVSDVCNLILPLPPLAEQERIVAKLEEILPLCERLR